MMSDRVVVLDNGGDTVKIGFAGDASPARVFPNCTARAKGERHTHVGDAILDLKDILGLTLRRPLDRGYLVNFELQREIWARALRQVLGVSPRDCGLLLTEPIFNLPAIRAETEQVVFEELGFPSLLVRTPPELAIIRHAELEPNILANRAAGGLVVDAGFSFTHAVPLFDGGLIDEGVRRINFGGKTMTNHFKELVSYRSLHLMEETYFVAGVKDALCFVSRDVAADLALAKQPGWKSPYRRDFVIPDGVRNLRGFVRDKPAPRDTNPKPTAAQGVEEQAVAVNLERFMVPEVLFHPSDIGLQQAGLAECIQTSVSACHPALHALLYSNVLLVGGMAQCPGFRERLYDELRPLVPDCMELNISLPEAPVTCAWEGGSMLGASREYQKHALSKAQYEERGGGRR